MKIILSILGTVFVALGVLGIFVPLLPTTPFLLLAAYLYFRSSEKLYNKLINSRYLGRYIRNFREHRAMSLRSKIIAVSLMSGFILYAIFFVVEALWLRILLVCIMTGVGYHILSYKTLTKEMSEQMRHKERRDDK